MPFYTYEQTGSFQGYIPAGNGLPARINARPQDEGQGVTLSEPFDSQPGDERRVTIRLNKGGVVEGSVVDKAGRPLPNVGVIGIPLDHLDSQDCTPWGKTDEKGRFRFEHVRPTEYEVGATIVPHMSVGDEPPQEKRRVAVPAGGHVEMEDLHFDPAGWTTPPPAATPAPAAKPPEAAAAPRAFGASVDATVRVSMADGSPLDRSRPITARWHSANSPPNGSSGASVEVYGSTFALYVPKDATKATVAVEQPGCAVTFAGPFTAENMGQLKGLEIRLTRGFTAAVQTVDEAGAPVAGARLFIRHAGPPTVELGEVKTDTAGLVALEHLGEAPLNIRVLADGFQADELTGIHLDPARPYRWTLRRARPLLGVVAAADGQPIAGAVIRLAGVEGPHEEMYADPLLAPLLTAADARGRFALTTLRPDSRYYLFVEAPGYGGVFVAGVKPEQGELRVALGPELFVRGRIIHAPPSVIHMGKLLYLQYGQTFNVGNNGAMASRMLTLEPKDGEADFTVGPFYAMQGEPAVLPALPDVTVQLSVDNKGQADFKAGDLPKTDYTFDLAPKPPAPAAAPQPAASVTPADPGPSPAASPPPAAPPAPAAEMLTARVKIVDEAGQPIAGATVTPDGLRPRGGAGGHYFWPAKELGPPAPAVTDAAGIAVVRYPRFLEDGQTTGAISFRAQHPDYCAVRPTNYRVEDPGKAEPVTLRRGAALRVSGHLPGSAAAVPIYPQQDDPTHISLAPDGWKDAGGNSLETRQLPVGRNYVRLAHRAADGALFFSETRLLNAVAGQTYALDLELRPGARVEGRLDASVPRPVRGGRVVVRAHATAPESDASWLGWHSWRDVAADGTFVFESLPPGRLEAAALCEGYTSVTLPDTEFSGTLNLPQSFDLLPGQTIPAEIRMQPAAACTVQVRDAAGAPVSGAQVTFSPNVRWTPGLTTIFCLPVIRMEDFIASRREVRAAPDWLSLNPFQAVSDARGNATVRNLPALKGSSFDVSDARYESFPPIGTRRFVEGGDGVVNLLPGETATATARLTKKGTQPRPAEEDAVTPEPSEPAAAPRARGLGHPSADTALAVHPLADEPGTFSGQVVGEDGRGLPGVRVAAWDWLPWHQTTTDAGGGFRLAGLEPRRRIEVRFSKEGCTPRLVVKQPLGALEQPLTLASRTYFEGVVTGPDGHPAADARVRANQGPKQADGVFIDTIWTETHTDARGHYRLYAQGDRYDVQVTTRAGGVARLPGVEIADGEARRLDIALRPGVVFRARVVDSADGAPVAGARLSNWQHPGVEGVSGPDGALEIAGLLPGRFEFAVAAGGFARWWSEQCAEKWDRRQPEFNPGTRWQRNFDRLGFELAQGMAPVTITLERGVRIRGRALDPEGRPVGGATVTAAHTGTGNSLAGDTRFSVATGEDGAFDLLLPVSKEGEYNLEVHDGKFGEWRRWANGVQPPIRTRPGQEISGVEIRLRRPASVHGRALDARGRPVAGQTVQASAADKLENRYYDPQATTDRKGRFALEFVRPGQQTIRLKVSRDGGVDSPRITEQTVDLPEGGSLDIELREADESRPGQAASPSAPAAPPAPDGEVRGVIQDAAGHPVANVEITPFGIAKGESTTYRPMRGLIDERAVTDGEGRFVLRHADPAGTFMALASAPGSARTVFNGLKPGPGGQTLVLQREAVLTGQALTAAGTPAAGVKLMLVQSDRSSEAFLGLYEATTDAQGRFRFEGVGPGLRYDLFGLMDPSAPGEVLPVRAVAVKKEGGPQDVGSCQLQAGHQVSGRVQLADGALLPAGSTLTLNREHAWDTQRLNLPPDGKFEFRGVPAEAVRFLARVPGYDNLAAQTQISLRDQSDALEHDPSSVLRDVATYERSGRNWQMQVAGDRTGVDLLLHADPAIEAWLAAQSADWIRRVEADYPAGTAGLGRAELRRLARQAQRMVGTPAPGSNPASPVAWRFVIGSESGPALAEVARQAAALGFEVRAPRRLREIEELAGLPPDALSPSDADHPLLGLEMRCTEPPSAEKLSGHELALRRLMQGSASLNWKMTGRVVEKNP